MIMSKPRILLYSDGVLFGGSEYVVVNILKNKKLSDKYDFYFAYRKHSDYQAHIESLFSLGERNNLYPLRVWSLDNFYGMVDKRFKGAFIKKLIKVIISICTRLQICNIYNYFYLKHFLKGKDYNLIHINNGGYPGAESCLVMARIAKDLDFKVIMQINNIPSPSKKYWDPIIKKSVDRFIIASKYTSSFISSFRDITNGNVYTLRDHIKEEKITINSQELREQLGVGTDSIVLIQVALLLRYKGQIYSLEAMRYLRESTPEFYKKVVLILIGDGEMEEELKKYIIEHDLSEHVKMLGYRNDYIDYINMADIMVHPSRANEDMPLIIMSAMSLKKPVISCNFAGIPEEVEHLKSGYLIDPQSTHFIEDLSKAIQITYENRDEYGRRGKEIFDTEFSEKQYELGLSSLYDSFLNSHKDYIIN